MHGRNTQFTVFLRLQWEEYSLNHYLSNNEENIYYFNLENCGIPAISFRSQSQSFTVYTKKTRFKVINFQFKKGLKGTVVNRYSTLYNEGGGS